MFLGLSTPIQCADTPQVEQCRHQNGDENADLDKARPTRLSNADCPGEQEYHFQIEDDEEYGCEVKMNGDTKMRTANRDYAGFERRVLVFSIDALTEEETYAQHEDYDHQHQGNVKKQRSQPTLKQV